MRKALPSTTSYYKTCAKHLPSVLSYKGCTKHFPVLLCTTKLAQSTSQYYFVVQRLHETLPSTCTTSFHKVLLSATLCYKVCTNHFPALLCTTKAWHSTFTHRSFCIDFAQRRIFCTERSVYTKKLLHSEAFTERSFYTEKLLHREAFAQRSVCTEKLLCRDAFYTEKRLHRETFTRISFYTEKLFHTASFYTQKPSRTQWATEIAALRPDPGAKAKKNNLKKKQFWSLSKLKKIWWKVTVCNFDAATPIRFTTLSCRRQCYYARGRSSKKHVCSHPTATAKTEFQSTIELRAMATEIAAPKGYKRHCNAFCNTRFQNNIVQEHAQHIQAARTVRTTPRVEAQPAPASQRSFPSAPAPATFHKKKQCFSLRHPCQNKSLATFMQALQCNQHNAKWQTRMYLRTFVLL